MEVNFDADTKAVQDHENEYAPLEPGMEADNRRPPHSSERSGQLPEVFGDEILRLIFACSHPALILARQELQKLSKCLAD